MNIEKYDVVFQEVPDEISLCFVVCGCPLKCCGCHSSELRTKKGTTLTTEMYLTLLEKYKGFVSCILFLGGEWERTTLLEFLNLAKDDGHKTCLYTGRASVDDTLLSRLDYIKVGAWVERLGGLSSKTTNQHFYEVKNKKLFDITHKFWRSND